MEHPHLDVGVEMPGFSNFVQNSEAVFSTVNTSSDIKCYPAIDGNNVRYSKCSYSLIFRSLMETGNLKVG